MNAAILAIVVALLTYGLTWAYIQVLNVRNRLEPPTARSMHKLPVPTGAGVVFVTVACTVWALSSTGNLRSDHIALLAAAAMLSGVSWFDDHAGGLSPVVRLLAHAAAVGLLLALMPEEKRILHWLPLGLERGLLGAAWIWFINLFNFMDGIDGLAGSEAVTTGLGYVLVASSLAAGDPITNFGLIIAAAAAGYLVWNWHPARVMMGDTGSIPLGFLLGWLMIDLAARGRWAPAVILPLYFAADATLTLFSRIAHGEKPWQPHRDHFYQRAVLSGRSHAAIVVRITIVNAVLVLLAVLSVGAPVLALVCAVAVVAMLLVHLEYLARHPVS